MDMEYIIGLVVFVAFVGFIVWKTKKSSGSSTGTGSGGGHQDTIGSVATKGRKKK